MRNIIIIMIAIVSILIFGVFYCCKQCIVTRNTKSQEHSVKAADNASNFVQNDFSFEDAYDNPFVERYYSQSGGVDSNLYYS